MKLYAVKKVRRAPNKRCFRRNFHGQGYSTKSARTYAPPAARPSKSRRNTGASASVCIPFKQAYLRASHRRLARCDLGFRKIGRASCRERVKIEGGAVSLSERH